MVHHNIAKRQKVDELETGEEAVLFNTDTLSKIISYLPSIDALSLALTCKRFGISDDDKKSVIKMSADILVHEIATEEQLAALPRYGGENALADYHYLQLMREPLTFDHLVNAEYVNSVDKSCIGNSKCYWTTESSTNILRAGKHYALFTSLGDDLMMGVMRPGKPNQRSQPDLPLGGISTKISLEGCVMGNIIIMIITRFIVACTMQMMEGAVLVI